LAIVIKERDRVALPRDIGGESSQMQADLRQAGIE